MRKLLFLSLLLIAVSGIASANSIQYTYSLTPAGNQGQIAFDAMTNTLTGMNIGINHLNIFDLDAWMPVADYTGLSGSLDFTLDTSTLMGTFSITGVPVALSGTISTSTLNGTCDANNTDCNITFLTGTSNHGNFDQMAGLGSGFTMASSTTEGGPWTAFSNGFTVTSTPEPGSLALLASGLAVLGGSLRRKLIRN